MHPVACTSEPDKVCLDIPDTIAIATYQAAVAEVERALASCNLIDWST